MPPITVADIIKREKRAILIIKGLAAELDVKKITEGINSVLKARDMDEVSYWAVNRWVNDNEELVAELVHRERIRIILSDWKVFKEHIFALRYKEIKRIETTIKDLLDELKNLKGAQKIAYHHAYRTLGILMDKKHNMLRGLGDFDKRAMMPKQLSKDEKSVVDKVRDRSQDVDDIAKLLQETDKEADASAMEKEADALVEESAGKILGEGTKKEFDDLVKDVQKKDKDKKD